MYQYEKRLDCRALGKEIKRRRKDKGWTQEHPAQLVDLTPCSIMYIENRGQHTSLNSFYKLVTLLDISADEFFYPDRHNGEDECRKHLDRMLNSMDEKELIIMEGPQRASEKPENTRSKQQHEAGCGWACAAVFATSFEHRASFPHGQSETVLPPSRRIHTPVSMIISVLI